MKKILEALKDLVTNANWDLSSEGMSLQVNTNQSSLFKSRDWLTANQEPGSGYQCELGPLF